MTGQSNGHASHGLGSAVTLLGEIFPPAAKQAHNTPAAQAAIPDVVNVMQAPEAVAAVLSPSQVWTLQDCAARWMFKHLWQLPDPKNGNLALGSAVHAALAVNFAQKIQSEKDLDLAAVDAAYSAAWAEQEKQTEFSDDEDPVEIEAQGRALVALYMKDAAPAIQPAAVEERVEGVIGGVRVHGYLDIRERNGRLRDIKTPAQKKTAATCSQKFQAATYVSLLGSKASGLVVIDQLVKTKTPQLVTLPHVVNDADRAALERQYPLAQTLARSGVYMPNRNSNLCNRRNCAHWRECEKQWGGEIPA